MNNETGQRLTEAIWALTNELRLFREQLPATPTTEPSHTGAAPVTSGEFEVGDWVRVTDSGWADRIGRVRRIEAPEALIVFPDLLAAWIHTNNLTKVAKP